MTRASAAGVKTRGRGGESLRDHAARTLPFALYLLFMGLGHIGFAQDLGIDGRWLYALQVGGAAGAMVWFARDYRELAVRPSPSAKQWLACAASGAAVFVVWVLLDDGIFVLGRSQGFDPGGEGGSAEWLLTGVRLCGAVLVVPVMEELFWRSYLMRLIDRRRFLALAPAQISMPALLLSAVGFGLEHHLWAAGIVAGLAYGWLYRTSGNLWTATFAHAVTNLLLGMYVLATGNWHLW